MDVIKKEALEKAGWAVSNFPEDLLGIPRHSGDYSDEDAVNCETDKFDKRKIKVICPYCHRQFAPLLSKFTKSIDGGWRWVFCSHKEPWTKFETTCRKCQNKMTFTLYTPQ